MNRLTRHEIDPKNPGFPDRKMPEKGQQVILSQVSNPALGAGD